MICFYGVCCAPTLKSSFQFSAESCCLPFWLQNLNNLQKLLPVFSTSLPMLSLLIQVLECFSLSCLTSREKLTDVYWETWPNSNQSLRIMATDSIFPLFLFTSVWIVYSYLQNIRCVFLMYTLARKQPRWLVLTRPCSCIIFTSHLGVFL